VLPFWRCVCRGCFYLYWCCRSWCIAACTSGLGYAFCPLNSRVSVSTLYCIFSNKLFVAHKRTFCFHVWVRLKSLELGRVSVCAPLFLAGIFRLRMDHNGNKSVLFFVPSILYKHIIIITCMYSPFIYIIINMLYGVIYL